MFTTAFLMSYTAREQESAYEEVRASREEEKEEEHLSFMCFYFLLKLLKCSTSQCCLWDATPVVRNNNV